AALFIQGSLDPFLQGLGNPSSVQIYNLNGYNQPGSINIEVPIGFEISKDGSVWLGAGNNLVLDPDSEAKINQNIYVRLNSNNVGVFSGVIRNIPVAGSVVTISVSGTVQNQPLAVSEVLVYWPLISGLD